ncbi:MAG: DUF6285 domain-containing protein [Actinomycetota bacterium]
MQDRPTAVELLRAAREFCEKDLGPQLTGRLRFHTRVLQNVLGILEREWDGEEAAVRAEWERLSELLGGQDEIAGSFRELCDRVRTANSTLAARIRAGELDDELERTADALQATVVDKLKIANPNYL